MWSRPMRLSISAMFCISFGVYAIGYVNALVGSQALIDLGDPSYFNFQPFGAGPGQCEEFGK